ncbi:MAG: hypothetical protein M3N59_00575 [bacterium]|nr:hypothetical protein [bacterium]
MAKQSLDASLASARERADSEAPGRIESGASREERIVQLVAWGTEKLVHAAKEAAAEGKQHAIYDHVYTAFPDDHWGEVMEGIAEHFRESGFAAASSAADGEPPCTCCEQDRPWQRAEVTISWA